MTWLAGYIIDQGEKLLSWGSRDMWPEAPVQKNGAAGSLQAELFFGFSGRRTIGNIVRSSEAKVQIQPG